MKQVLITNSFKETQKMGFNLGKNLKGGEIFALYGNLGSGKTTFVQGLAKGLGIKQKIISPTFIIVRKYNIPSSSSEASAKSRKKNPLSSWSGNDHDRISAEDSIASLQNDRSRQARIINFYHIDLYRIEDVKDIHGLGLEEILHDKSNIVAIEWPEKIEKVLPKDRTEIHFEYIGNSQRQITGSL